MNKKFTNALRPDIKVRRTGLFGFGRKIEVSEGGDVKNPVTYRVDRRGANAETAAAINSRIPVVTIRKPS
jgi:hypothetical protein